MRDRIISIIKEKNLTVKDFVERVGIQRSTLSHILSGRNNPSVELLIKILNTFPDINAEWLLTGNGDMYKKIEENTSEPLINIPLVQPDIKEINLKNNENEEVVGPKQNLNENISNENNNENIKKIIILYNNNTAEVYKIRQ